MQTFEILGKKYQIQSSLEAGEAGRINGEITRRLKSLTSEYPALDKIDILSLYIIELNEKISEMEKNSGKESSRLDKIRNKIILLEEKVAEELKNLTKYKMML